MSDIALREAVVMPSDSFRPRWGYYKTGHSNWSHPTSTYKAYNISTPNTHFTPGACHPDDEATLTTLTPSALS